MRVVITIIIASLLSMVVLIPKVTADFRLVLEHKENFKIYRNTLDSPIGLNGSEVGYILHAGEALFVSWKVTENPLILPPIVWLLTEQQRNHFSHIIGGPSLLYGHILKTIEWEGNFSFSVQQNGTYYVVLHNIAWGALDLSGPILDVESYEAVLTIPSQAPLPYGPKAEFVIIPETAHVDETAKFDASSSQAGSNGTNQMSITEYRWDFGDGNKTVTTTPLAYHSYNISRRYYPTLSVFAGGATPETDSITKRVDVISVPVGGYSVTGEGVQVNTAQPLIPYILLSFIFVAVLTTKSRRLKKR